MKLKEEIKLLEKKLAILKEIEALEAKRATYVPYYPYCPPVYPYSTPPWTGDTIYTMPVNSATTSTVTTDSDGVMWIKDA